MGVLSLAGSLAGGPWGTIGAIGDELIGGHSARSAQRQSRADSELNYQRGLASAKQANVWRQEAAQKQMDFQERLSSTAHQRQVQDMRSAGLNPILSATGGKGASTAQGAMPQVETPAATAADVKAKSSQARLNSAQLARLHAETARLQAQQRLTDVSTAQQLYALPRYKAEAGYYDDVGKYHHYATTGGALASVASKAARVVKPAMQRLTPGSGIRVPKLKRKRRKTGKFNKETGEIYPDWQFWR